MAHQITGVQASTLILCRLSDILCNTSFVGSINHDRFKGAF